MKDNCNSRRNGVLPKRAAGLTILSLVFLFNPSFNLVDILPDFVAYFILAHVFDKASDCAPYFDEARRGFIRLAYLCLAKIPALAIIVKVRSGNISDNDIIALFCLIFATAEIILVIPAIRNIFSALTYLGERSDAKSLISSDSLVCTDNLRTFTLAFSIFKCLLYFIPELTRLTRSVELESGIYVKTGSRYYPWMVLVSVVTGLIVGAVWLSRSVKLVKKIRNEGRFSEALASVAAESSFDEYEKRRSVRALSRTFLLFIIASVLLINVSFSNLYSIDLLPDFLFSSVFTVALYRMAKRAKLPKNLRTGATVIGAVYTAVSVVSYAVSFKFFTEYGYDMLYEGTRAEAVALYKAYELIGIASFVLHAALSALFFITMRRYLTSTLGTPIGSEEYRPSDAAYHRYLNTRTLAYSVVLILSGFFKLASIISSGSVELIFTNPNDVTRPTMIVSTMPWIPTVNLIVTVIFVLYSIYYFNFIKEEMSV